MFVLSKMGTPIRVLATQEDVDEAMFYLCDPTVDVTEVPYGMDLGILKAGYRVWSGLVTVDGQRVFRAVERTDLEIFFREAWYAVPEGEVTYITAKTEAEAEDEFERRLCAKALQSSSL